LDSWRCSCDLIKHRTDGHVGSEGDYAIDSAMEFFPLFAGGLLVSTKRDSTMLELIGPSLVFEIKGLVSFVEYAMRYGRLRLISLRLTIAIKLKDVVWGMIKNVMKGKTNRSHAPPSSEGAYARPSLDPCAHVPCLRVHPGLYQTVPYL
jgi:hypothetical protein